MLSLSGNYNNVNYPAPSFVNPIPWKPIHVPQEDGTPRKGSARKRTAGAGKSRSSRCLTHTPRDAVGLACKRRWHWPLLVSVQYELFWRLAAFLSSRCFPSLKDSSTFHAMELWIWIVYFLVECWLNMIFLVQIKDLWKYSNFPQYYLC